MIARASKDAFAQRLDHYRTRVDTKLAEILASDAHIPERLRAAMQYSVLGGGKRVRPLLVVRERRSLRRERGHARHHRGFGRARARILARARRSARDGR